MKILKSDLQNAAQKEIITPNQVEKLWDYFESLRPDQAKFSALHLLYYFGGLIILASMSWFIVNVWSDGLMIMIISGAFAAMYLIVGNNLWSKQNLKIPAGLLITAAIGLVPIFIYGFQITTNLWTLGYGNYLNRLFMEIGIIVAAIIALRFYKFSFITFPIAITLWYMSMDLTPLIFGNHYLNFEEGRFISCIFGLLMLIIAYFVDKKFKEIDFAFWIYLYGMLAFWVSLSFMDRNSELDKFIYCLINIGLIISSVYLRRKLFAVFGVVGVIGYICHLSWVLFEGSYIFPIILTFLGIIIIAIGVKYQQNKKKFEAVIESLFPTFLNKWRPAERA
jgi:hypothetical protein